jgi:hypothetical protein
MSLFLKSPKMLPNTFSVNINSESILQKSVTKVSIIYTVFQKLPKVNNRPLGENSPNLATLPECKTYIISPIRLPTFCLRFFTSFVFIFECFLKATTLHTPWRDSISHPICSSSLLDDRRRLENFLFFNVLAMVQLRLSWVGKVLFRFRLEG